MLNPYRELYDPSKRYLISIHPHGILLDGLHSSVARYGTDYFNGEGGSADVHPTGERNTALCFAPVIQHVPTHQVRACLERSRVRASSLRDKCHPLVCVCVC